jgi:ABC-type phosphate transport system permease subunit
VISAFIGLLLFLIVGGLAIKSYPILESHSLGDLLFKSLWKPRKNEFGFLPYILSTVYVTLISITIAVPLCILCSIYLSEYANKKVKGFVTSLVDILAGIPSVIFGIWGYHYHRTSYLGANCSLFWPGRHYRLQRSCRRPRSGRSWFFQS